MLRSPQVANRSCAHCLIYVYDDDTGAVEKGRDKKPVTRKSYGFEKDGTLVRKPACQTHRGCPKGTPEDPNSLLPQNVKCYEHYLECRAVGVFPDDQLVRENAKIIRGVIDNVARVRELEYQRLTLEMGAGGDG